MILPSGFQPETGVTLATKEIGTGMYAVEGAYRGHYDFFAPSPLFVPTKHAPNQDFHISLKPPVEVKLLPSYGTGQSRR